MSGRLETVRYFIQKQREFRLGHGPIGEGEAGWVDAKPYITPFPDGTFEGYKPVIWKYYEVPEDVKITWLRYERDAVINQHFLIDILKRLAATLESQVTKKRDDLRRNFHIVITRYDTEKPLPVYKGCTPAHADWIQRHRVQYTRPLWRGFMGVELLRTNVFYEAYGVRAKLERYLEWLKAPDQVRWEAYQEEFDDIDSAMTSGRFRTLNFYDDLSSYTQLTAWHGVPDEVFALPQQLQYIRFRQPVHGLSLWTPRWGEIMAHAVVPMDRRSMFLVNPEGEGSRWALPLYEPGANTVAISIRGQIRSSASMEAVLDAKREKSYRKAEKRSESEQSGRTSYEDMMHQRIEQVRRIVVDGQMPALDNVEITVFTKVTGRVSQLPEKLSAFGMNAAPLVGRQHNALLSTFPCYPHQIHRIRRGNTRPTLVNAMLPGALAMSGVLKRTRPCDSYGMLVGLSDLDYEYQELYAAPDAAYKRHSPPGFMVTGRPGAGKALSLDTPIMTPSGPVPMGKIKIGDQVFGGDGKPCQVTFTTPVMHDHEVFRITLSDGQEFLADADHQWIVGSAKDLYLYAKNPKYGMAKSKQINSMIQKLSRLADRMALTGPVRASDLLDILASTFGDSSPWIEATEVWRALDFNDCPYSIRGKRERVYDPQVALKTLALRLQQQYSCLSEQGQLYRRMTTGELYGEMLRQTNDWVLGYVVPLVHDGVQYPQKDLPVDPYVLGLWLGSGDTWGERIVAIGSQLGNALDTEGFGSNGDSWQEGAPIPLDLLAQLKNLGVWNETYIPDLYTRSSMDQRIALLQGLMDSSGNAISSSGECVFSNTNPDLVGQVVGLVRSLGLRCQHINEAPNKKSCHYEGPTTGAIKQGSCKGGEIAPRRTRTRASFVAPFHVFRLPRKLAMQCLDVTSRSRTIQSIEQVDSVPVKCISVDSPDHTYLIGDAVPTSNTQFLLQAAAQIVYMGMPTWMLNPKKSATFAPFFDALGGVTITMNNQFLSGNPGLLDPVFFLKSRAKVVDILADAIFMANRMYDDKGSESSQRRTSLRAQLMDRAMDARNTCSWDIIFGNPTTGTSSIDDAAILQFVEDRWKTSPFWRAFIAKPGSSTNLVDRIAHATSVCMEWDGEMQLPDASTPPSDYKDKQIDSIISVNVAFLYASESIDNSGGAVIIDEGWALKGSRESMTILQRSGREWRQANILLMIGTQNILDFLNTRAYDGTYNEDMSSYFSRYKFMAINDSSEAEIAEFFRRARIPRTPEYEDYMIHANVDPQNGAPVARAFYVDLINGWYGGIISGPWPVKELTLGRTDAEGEIMRRRMLEAQEAASSYELDGDTSFGGILRSVIGEDGLPQRSSDDEAWLSPTSANKADIGE